MKGEFMLGTIFAGKWKGIMLKWLLIASMVGGIIQHGLGAGYEAAAAESVAPSPHDIAGHGAENPMNEWMAKGPRSLEIAENGGSPSGTLPSGGGGGPVVAPIPNPPVETAVTAMASLSSVNGFRSPT